MNKDDILSYVFDFLSFAFSQKGIWQSVRKVILFGSVARGDYSKDSDIDIFFDTRSDPEKLRSLLRKSLSEFEVKAKNTWNLKGIDLPIKPVVGDIDDKTWEPLKGEIISYGITLFGRYEELPKKTSHRYIISYSLSKLHPNEKMRFLREIFGYTNRINRKVYTQEGLLKRIGGEKINPNSISIPIDSYKEVMKILGRFNIPYRIYEAFIKES